MNTPAHNNTWFKDYPDYIFAIIMFIWVIFFLSGIFSLPLMPPDEPKYAFAASKMIDTGDFITPYFNCEPRFDKPPLIYWFIVVSYKIFGVSDWAARIPSLLATLGVIYLLYRETQRRFDTQAAVLTILVFANMPHVWVMGRAVAPEMLLVFFEVASIFSFYHGLDEEKKGHISLGYVFAACAFLTKGPIGVILPLSIIFLYFLYKKGILYTTKKLLNPVGIILFLIIGLPWYIAMFKIYGYRYFEEFFLYHNVYRFTGQARQHPFSFYYYIPILLGSLYLWLPFSREIWMHVRKVFQEKSDEIFFVFWALFVLIFFTVSVNKLHNYILIAYPPLAIIIGTSLVHMTFQRKSIRNIYIGVAIGEFAGLAYAAFHMNTLYTPVLLGGCLVVFVTVFAILKGDTFEKTFSFVITKGLVILLSVNLFMAGYELQLKPADAFMQLEVQFEKSPIYFYKEESEDIVFYANRCISIINTNEDLERVTQQHEEIMLFTKGKYLDDLKGLNTDFIVPFNDIHGHKRYLIEIEKGCPR